MGRIYDETPLPGRIAHLSEEFLQQSFRPPVVKIPVFSWMTDVGAVNDQRQHLRFIQATIPQNLDFKKAKIQ